MWITPAYPGRTTVWGAPARRIALAIWSGFMTPCRAANLRRASTAGVVCPAGPTTGVPSIAEMSSASSTEWEAKAERAVAAAAPVVCRPAAGAHVREETLGRSPEADRKASVASTRRSTRPSAIRRRSQAARWIELSRGTCCSSWVFDSSKACPGVAEILAKGSRPLALTTEELCSLTQPSSIGLGSTKGVPMPAGLIWKTMCGSAPGPTCPSTVPAITWAPTRRGCR